MRVFITATIAASLAVAALPITSVAVDAQVDKWTKVSRAANVKLD